ncbi:MAG: hypothetical protein JNM52_07370, partial [Betaproteobacteria bacterium]|nr:hypothetical protein [Betaproteobacteria bacterium]
MPKVFVGEREVLAPPSATPFARNVMHFVRLLRTAGLAIGPDRLLDALHALTLVDLSDRIQVKAALAAVLLRKYEEEALFDQAFALFWRDPDLQAKMMALLLPQVEGRAQSPKPPAGQRIAEAFFPATKPVNDISTTDPREIDIDATLTWSEEERLRHADFETLTVAEWQAVKRLMARLTLPLPALPSRRFSAAPHARGGGRFDLRRTLRASLGVGGDS